MWNMIQFGFPLKKYSKQAKTRPKPCQIFCAFKFFQLSNLKHMRKQQDSISQNYLDHSFK
jgi:hypothetical protein